MKKKDWLKSLVKLICLIMALTVFNPEDITAIPTSGYDTTRIFKAMAKARRGENVTVGVIGSSITAGSISSSVETRWANLMADWWESTFPQSTITLINAGFGGAKSDYGTHRVQMDLLKFNPDFVVFEYINDIAGDYAVKMMEGLVRQLLLADSLPGTMMLVLKQVDGVSPVTSHKQVADHYSVPLVNFAALIDGAVAEDGIALESIFADGILHPNDAGMAYIAEFIKDELNRIYSVLPADSLIDTINTVIPTPIITDVYAHTYLYTKETLVPTRNSGWEINGNGWIGHNPGDEITFTIDGSSISIMYTQFNTSNLGQAEVWIDDGAHFTFDGYFNENWGPATRFALIGEGLSDGNHTLHIKITGNNSAGSTGHDFQVLSVLKAGNFKSASPIANAGVNIKTLTNTAIQLIGAGTDPDNDTIQSFNWSIISKPAESVNSIINENNDTASFIPDAAGYYLLGLVVNDGNSNSVVATKVIHAVVSNEKPVANAGNDTTVAPKLIYTLNGNQSSDADSDPLFFFWRIILQPTGSTVLLNLPNTVTPNFRPRIEGEYKIGLVVNDSLENSIEDEIIISVFTNISSVEQEAGINSYLKTYPNPVKDQLIVEYNQSLPGKAGISIFDITGKKLIDYSTSNQNIGNQSFNLQLDPLLFKKGMYFIVLKTLNGLYSDTFIIE